MYGYIKTHTPELRVREQEYYRAVYCGLCRTMGKCTGQCSRLTLSYDFAFFALVRMALEGREPVMRQRRCPVHPLRKRPMAETDEVLSLCACASAVMAYHKLRDDKQDEKGGRRLRAVLASPYVGHIRRKALRKGFLPLDERVAACMRELSALEAERPLSVDRPAELFGELMADLLSYGLEGNAARLGRELGLHVGRWVYILDAVDDFEEDKTRGRYNPLACLWQGGELTDERRRELHNALLAELVAVEKALDLADPGHTENSSLWGVIRNVLYGGMPMTTRRILFPDTACEGKKKRKASKDKADEEVRHG